MHVGARDHQLANLNLVELHGVLHELHFGGLKEAAIAGLFDDHLQFFGGANAVVAGGRGDAEPETILSATASRRSMAQEKSLRKA